MNSVLHKITQKSKIPKYAIKEKIKKVRKKIDNIRQRKIQQKLSHLELLEKVGNEKLILQEIYLHREQIKNIDNYIHNQLRNLRLYRGFTLKYVAFKMKMTEYEVFCYENKINKLTFSLVNQFANFYEVDVGYFFTIGIHESFFQQKEMFVFFQKFSELSKFQKVKIMQAMETLINKKLNICQN